jgi:hypothetical protein
MLCRVSCEACHISCLWTDDPKSFLESVCLRYRHCQAKLMDEGFDRPLSPVKAKSARISAGKLASGKATTTRIAARHSAPAR